MASLGHISLDGSKFKANSSKHKAMSYGRLKAKEIELSAEIDELITIRKKTISTKKPMAIRFLKTCSLNRNA